MNECITRSCECCDVKTEIIQSVRKFFSLYFSNIRADCTKKNKTIIKINKKNVKEFHHLQMNNFILICTEEYFNFNCAPVFSVLIVKERFLNSGISMD
jgi:hypothetical protein